MVTWILIADAGGARLMSNAGPTDGLHLVRDIPHPEGRKRNRDFDSDRPGSQKESVSHSFHATSLSQSPVERQEENFARQVAEVLDHGRIQGAFDRLVLVCEPKFLGLVRQELDRATLDLVHATMAKDLRYVTDDELPGHLREVLPMADVHPRKSTPPGQKPPWR